MRKIKNSIVNKLLDKILEYKWINSFKLKTAPRWLILMVDMFIVSVSFSMFAISDVFSGVETSGLVLLRNLAIVVTVYFLVTYFIKSYTCIIRLSVIEDLYREALVVVIATALLLFINTGALIVSGEALLRFWHIIIIGAISFAFLVLERLVVKYLYSRLTLVHNNRKRVLVLGTSLNSLILANALQNEIDGKYFPVGLLSTKADEEKTQINGFKVYNYAPETMSRTFQENGIHALIFNPEQIDVMRHGFSDFFIKNNLRMLSINKVQEYELDEGKDENANISTFIKEVQIEDLLGRDPIVLNNTLVRSHIKDSCVLITGACGSIGSEIVRQVVSYKAKRIILVDQAETPMHDLALELHANFPEAQVVLFMGDVQNYDRMEQAFSKYRPNFVFHAAAYKHVPMMELNPTEAVLTNVMGTKNIADLALKYEVIKFVMVSTDKAVNPSNIMGCTKRLAEVYTQSLFFKAHEQGKMTQFITTRFGNVLGSNGSVIPLFRKQIKTGGPVTVTHRDIIRYFMTIPEACSLVLEAGCMGKGGEIYIFDMGEPIKIYDLATRMISLAGLRPGIDIKIIEVGLRAGEKLYEELLNDKEKTIKTDNEKIMIAKVRTYDFNEVCDNIGNIIKFAACGDKHDMVSTMKRFIPEFKSHHSEFEKIDAELEAEKHEEVPATPDTEVYY